MQRGLGWGADTHQLPEVAIGLDQTLQALHEVLLVDGRVVDGEVTLLTEQVAAEDVEPAGEGQEVDRGGGVTEANEALNGSPLLIKRQSLFAIPPPARPCPGQAHLAHFSTRSTVSVVQRCWTVMSLRTLRMRSHRKSYQSPWATCPYMLTTFTTR